MHRSRGFNLIELMIVLAIVGILVAVATPSWKDMVVNNRTRAAINDWIASAQFARSEALRTNGPVTLCASSDGVSCTNVAGENFDVGWIVKTGTNAVGGALLQDTVAKPGISMLPAVGTFRSLTFLPNGLPIGGFAGVHLIVHDIDPSAPNYLQKHICIARTGRTRVFTDDQWKNLPSNSCEA
jgi:type IV fimbrial biogenesis protein FimT